MPQPAHRSRNRSFAALLAALACIAFIAWPAVAAAPVGAARIPLIVGLTTVRAIAEPVGDYESLLTVVSVDRLAYRLTLSSEVPNGPGRSPSEIRVARTVLFDDHRAARVVRNRYNVNDAATFAGTSPSLSSAVLGELRSRGQAGLTLIDSREVAGVPSERRFAGTMTRVTSAPATLRMLVNGRPTELAVIHAKGTLADARGSFELEFDALDDADNPLLLTSKGPGFSTRIVRIQYPEPKGPESIEARLAERLPADIYGIFFTFASATLRPESEPVLSEIADVMTAHPDWTLQVDGHTDAIGGDAANLDLSKRRSAAVKAALVERYGIAAARLATDGHGARSPKDRNDTAEGRARNRRVELRRR